MAFRGKLYSFIVAAAALSSALIPSSASANTYPERMVRIIVPFAAGGFTDTMARLMAKNLQERLGQPFIVENKPGAGGNIAAEAVAKSAPNGYTLFVSTITTHGINPSIYKKLSFDPVKDFAPIILLASTPNVLVVNKPGIKTVADLVKASRDRPRGLNYGSSGVGTSSHLVGVLFQLNTGTNMVHVPYKGSAQAMLDLAGGQVDFMFDNLLFQAQHIRSGKLHAVGVTSKSRSPLLPDTPTMSELGVNGMDYGAWFGISAPAGTPKEVIAKLNAELQDILRSPNVIKAMAGADLGGGTPAQYGEFISSELQKWKQIVEKAGISRME
jgi:tripartite-type tricarboxylate transporter receptor subunit TctC